MEDNKVVISIETPFKGENDIKKAKEGLQSLADKTEKVSKASVEMGRQGNGCFSSLATGAAKLAGIVVAIKGSFDFIASSINANAMAERSVNMLAAAYQNVGFTAAGALETAKQFASEMQKLTGLSDETFLDAQRQLANYKVVGTEAQEAIRAAYALSVNQGMAFESALQLITRAAVGNTSALSRHGIVLGENVKEGDKFAATVAKINEQFGPSAQKTMGDAISKTNALKEHWGDFKEKVGDLFQPLVKPILSFLNEVIDSMEFWLGLTKIVFEQISFAGVNAFLLIKKAVFNTLGNIGEKLAYVLDLFNKIPGVHIDAANGVKEWADSMRQAAKEAERAQNINADAAIKALNFSKKVTDEQKKQIDLNAEQINAQRQLNAEKKDRVQAEKEATKALEQQRKILDNMGLSSSKDLKGWNRGAEDSQQGPTDLEVFAGGGNQLASAADSVMQYDAEAQRLEELRALKQEYIEQEITDEQLKQEALTNLNEQYATQKLVNDKKTAQARQQVYASMWSALTGLASSENKKVAAVGKVASVAQATMSMFTGAAKALELPFPANLAAVATVLAQGAALVSQIESVKLANGGLVKAVTGGVNAVIGEGGSDEAVLPLDNARAMRRIGGAIADESGGLGGGAVINVNINAAGGLVPFLDELTEATQNGVTEALRYANVAVKAGKAQGGLSV